MALRIGMWVAHQGRVGIVTRIGPSPPAAPSVPEVVAGVVELHLVNGSGETIAEAIVPVAEVRQAYVEEVPELRRAHQPAEWWTSRGYLSRGA